MEEEEEEEIEDIEELADDLIYYTLPPKDQRTRKDYLLYPFRLLKCYFTRILFMCNWRFCIFLIISQMLIKGMLYRITVSSMLPIFKNLGVDAGELQIFSTVAMSPWTLKPLVGVCSDIFICRGYHKKYWLIQAVLFGTIASSLAFGVLEYPRILLLCYMGMHYEMSIIDLLSESKYAEIMQIYPESGSDIVTFVNGLQTIGGVIAMSFIGQLADAKLFSVVFIFAVILAQAPFFPSLLTWLPEDKSGGGGTSSSRWFEVDKQILVNNRALFAVVAFTGFAGPVIAFLATYTNRIIGLVCAILLLLASVCGTYLAFPRTIANVALYQVLNRLTKPSMSTALDYFYTATPTCLPDGPHFSFKYFLTYTGIASAAVAFIAVWVYQAFLSRWRFRNVLILTTCLVGLGGVSDLLIVLRVNRKLGISDHAFYMFGEAVFETMVDMLFWIPSSVIISKVCASGVESATYAFLAGLSNFALMIAELSGALIFQAAGVKKCEFDNLWWLVLVFHIILPVAGGIPITFLIPNDKQDMDILREKQFLVREYNNNDMVEFEEYTDHGSRENSLDFEHMLTPRDN